MASPIGHAAHRPNRRRRRRSLPVSEINITPFVDVMLVLLIVFMVTAPLLSAGVPVDLPEAQVKPLAVEKEPIIVTINTEGHVFLKDNEVALDDLVAKLSALTANDLDQRIYVRGDKSVSYGTIMRVMGTINGAGFRHIALVALKEPTG